MNHIVINPFTQTKGAKEGEIMQNFNYIIPLSETGIKNKNELFPKIIGKNGKPFGKYAKLKNFIDNLEEHLKKEYTGKIDPVIYLHYLYRSEKYNLSAHEVHERTKNFSQYKDPDNIRNTFQNVFGWEKKGNLDISETTRRKMKVTGKKNSHAIEQQEEKKRNIIHVEKVLTRIARNKDNMFFSPSIFKSCKNISERASYLLKIDGYHNNNFEEMIFALKNKYGTRVTSEAIQNILNGISEKLDINVPKLAPPRIREIGKKYQKVS